ncbi:MAG: hypothetical protein ABSG10_02260 [Terracidiphilus sp.]|jgi:hypothetical protein
MKRYASWFILSALLLTASVLTATKGNAQAKYKVVEVKHLTKADSVSLSTEYLNQAYDDLRQELAKTGIFGTVVEDGAAISDADAANAVVLECNITDYKTGVMMPPYIIVDVTLSNRSDHSMIKQFNSGKLPLNNGGRVPPDDVKAKNTGRFLAEVIKRDLK